MWRNSLIAGFLLSVSAHTSALCMATEPVSAESAHDFYVALSTALQMTKEGRDEATAAVRNGTFDQPPAILLTALKTTQLDYACAQQYIEGYTKSKNAYIKASAGVVVTGLQSLQLATHGVEQAFTDVYDGQFAAKSEGLRAQWDADRNVLFNEGWDSVTLGVVASSNAAAHYSNGRFDGLTLSAAQRADVINRLKALGPDVEHQNNNPPLEAAVATLLKFLQDKRLKSYGTD